MAFTRRGRVAVGALVTVLLAVAGVGVLALTGKGDEVLRRIPIFGKGLAGEQVPLPATAPPVCPLTGEVRTEGVPERQALAVKVENLPQARPQAGLAEADIVYEEPVEGGITRFIAVFHCGDAERVGPVRSARHTDVGVLLQYGTQTLFGFAGGAPPVERAIADAGFGNVSFEEPAALDAYERDPAREAPHDLYTSTTALFEAGEAGALPAAQFTYRKKAPARGESVQTVHLDWSPSADVFWRFHRTQDLWLRSHGDEAHLLEGEVQVSADNVVVQVVQIRETGVVDAAGNRSPEAVTVGSGEALVFRDGRVFRGTWERPNESDLTTFLDERGRVIPLAPGTTWVELFPSDRPIETE